MASFRIGDRDIGPAHPPFIIAELSGNHKGSLERALKLVDAAAAAGADAVKLQTYTADSMTLDCDAPGFVVGDKNPQWAGRTLYQLYKEAATPYAWHEVLFERARDDGLLAFSSPFDEAAVEFLRDLGVPAFKIASFENEHVPLLKAVARTGKPVVLSTGMIGPADLDQTVNVLRSSGCDQLALLKCTSAYPAAPEASHVRAVGTLAERYGCVAGLSDHTLGVGVALAAVAHGACIVEKHLTLDRADGAVDSTFSLEPKELELLVREARRAHESLGSSELSAGEGDAANRVYKRSIFVASKVQAGDPVTPTSVRVIRPGHGLHPRHYDEIMGRRFRRGAQPGTPLSWDLLD